MSACSEDGTDLRRIVQQSDSDGRMTIGAGKAAASFENQRSGFRTVEVGVEIDDDLIEAFLRQAGYGNVSGVCPECGSVAETNGA